MATAIKRKRHNEVGGTFRLVTGSHLDYGPEGCECDGCQGGGGNHVYNSYQTYLGTVRELNQKRPRHSEPIKATPPDKYDDDIITSSVDLVARFGASKFQRVDSAKDDEITRLRRLVAEMEAKLAGAATESAGAEDGEEDEVAPQRAAPMTKGTARPAKNR